MWLRFFQKLSESGFVCLLFLQWSVPTGFFVVTFFHVVVSLAVSFQLRAPGLAVH